MAKFNTIAGGYYGKLGATVGQRWKNLRTVRSYVIPQNPQTPTQQANRSRFADCIFYAQLASQMNPKVTAFDTTSRTLWNCRMSTARALQDLQLSELQRIPLYPTTFSVPYTISAASITDIIDETHVVVTVEGTLPNEERVLALLLKLPGAEDWKSRLALCIGTNEVSTPNIFTFRLPEGLMLRDGIEGRFVSCDDSNSAQDLITSSQISIPINVVVEQTFDTTIKSVKRNGNLFTITFNEVYQEGTSSIGASSLYCVSNGAFVTRNIASPTFINDDGYFAITYESSATTNQQLEAFPSASRVNVGAIEFRNSTYHLTSESVSRTVSNDDLQRTYANSVTSVSRSGTTFTFALANTLPTHDMQSGSASLRAVSRGKWVTRTISVDSLSGTSFTYADTATLNEDVLAFPSGATVTFNVSFNGNGVTYTPQTTTAQPCTSSDLTRTIEQALEVIESGGAAKVQVTLSDNLDIKTASVVATLHTFNGSAWHNVQETCQVDTNGSKARIALNDNFNNLPWCVPGTTQNLQTNVDFTALGVTYRWVAGQAKAVQGNSYYASLENIADVASARLLSGAMQFDFEFENLGASITTVSDLQAPSNISLVDNNGITAEFAISSSERSVVGSSTIDVVANGSISAGAGFNYGDMYLSDDFEANISTLINLKTCNLLLQVPADSIVVDDR